MPLYTFSLCEIHQPTMPLTHNAYPIEGWMLVWSCVHCINKGLVCCLDESLRVKVAAPAQQWSMDYTTIK
jgi:hypothetical protein